ncbi:uncharacterized protein LOC125025189 [Penaeus chinensis]|uniref:uncharacterized protein LOC125025189 n=1 Tax=Penaeus chinensis TaxID=139456 RepID=UPI001FB7E318|nr:uncharacterized protein LOC125025189 [Penaeus chinensis]
MGPAGVFTCEAVYHGRRQVQGSQSSATLTALVDHLVHAPVPTPAHDAQTYTKLRRERCQLQCDDERLRVTPVRKDEGFESDSESSGSACDESCCGTQDIKVISDHVLRLDQLIHEDGGSVGFASASDDTSSSATSSGAESEDDTPRSGGSHHPHPNQHTQVDAAGGIGDMFLMSDILYCHVAAATPRVVVVVVKDAGSSQVFAHVFQCLTEDAARSLYAHYKEASNKYKLNRYRNSKRKTELLKGETVGQGGKVVSASGGGTKKGAKSLSHALDGGGGRGSVRSVEARVLTGEKRGDTGTNVNVIEIRETQEDGEKSRPWNLVQHTDANGVTHIEIESGPCSLVSSSSEVSDFSSMVSLAAARSGQSAQPASLLAPRPSSRAEAFSSSSGGDGGSVRGTSSCPSSLVSNGREVLVAGETDKKFRQRQPALLLREDLARQAWRADERRGDDSLRRSEKKRDDPGREDKKRESRRDDHDGRSRRERYEGDRMLVREVTRATMEAMIPRITTDRQGRPRDHSRGRLRHSHNKGPAPPPPPRRHPNNPSLMLVPTKSGTENARAFYPKESHIVRGNKLVRVDYPAYPGGWMHQDVNNNPHHYNYYAGAAWLGPHEYHALRHRDPPITPEMRRRSRSKSPARRPMAHRYIDAVSTFSISQKLKDFSDAVFTSKKNNNNVASNAMGNSLGANCGQFNSSSDTEVKGHQRSLSTASAPAGDGDGTLRPVIKKGRRPENSPQTRRVTFSAYATVQVMDA